MTVFDFAAILERTERRVEIDLLGAGPKTVDELRSIAGRLKLKYQNQLERKIQRHLQQQERTSATPASSSVRSRIAAKSKTVTFGFYIWGGGGIKKGKNNSFG